ncbi:MAG: excalibur calcium-binding domain-containing protein [Acidimicrobiales bacterium]
MHASGRSRAAVAVVAAMALAQAAVACAPSRTTAASSSTAPASTAAPAATTEPRSTTPALPGPAEVAPSTTAATDGTVDTTTPRDLLAQLSVDDRPHGAAGYRRDEWPHWRDIDGDGCDARQQALIAASTTRAQVDLPCTVVAGDWVSDYDGFVTADPGALDVDHVVPLEDAYASGGWAWSTDQRTRYANDQADLWVVSATSNRSKGARSPDQWRPPNQAIWCTYAQRWAQIKIRWQLTVTTSERGALGQMLDTCAGAPATSPPPPAARQVPDPTTTAPPTTLAGAGGPPVSFKNCAEARAAGRAPIRRGEPGYAEKLDGDKDGVACE